ncbi:MAG TPA: glutathione-disulfide reductase [Candidatus Binatia bacterium]|nr:glutathione-disulfide reductase [Candidatus Binatia bacterium]
MPKYDYDLLTIGAGSGGVRASRMAASYGARVAVAEESSLGGTCVNLGCIPKKLLVYASHFAHDFEDAAAYGWNVGERSFDWRRLIANKDREIARLNGVYRRLLEGSGVAIVNGRATVVSPHEVDVDGRRISARHLLIATGSRPYVPGLPGCDLAVTSDQMFHLDELPRRMVIVGGGYIAVEFAGILHGLGVEVTQLYRGPLFLQGFDDDVRSVLADEMRKAGVNLRFDDGVKRIDRSPDGRFSVSLESGGVLAADLVLYATGRLPNTRGLGLESAGVALEPNGAVAVDEYSRSSVPCIHAIGDVTDRINLTPVAIHEGMAIAATLFAGRPTKPDYANVPSAVFSQPNVGTVGLTERVAGELHAAIDVYRTRFRPLKHTLTGRDETTMMKLVVERATDRVLGCHMVGPEAGEIVQGLAIAVKCHAKKAQFDATIGIHPTGAEEFVTMREPVADVA